MHEFKTCEEALKLAQNIETDDKGQSTISSINNKLKDKIEKLQNSLMALTLQKNNLWCTNYQNEGHIKDNCKFVDYFNQDV